MALIVLTGTGAWLLTDGPSDPRASESSTNDDPANVDRDDTADADREDAERAVPSRRSDDSPTGPSAASEDAAGDDAPPDGLAACVDEVETANRAVDAAESGAQNWAAHVQARTDLLAGEIGLTDVDEIFGRTRKAGPDDLDQFDAAERAYQSAADACDGLVVDSLDADWRSTAEDCLRHADSAQSTVDAATAVIDDWRAHLAAMRAHDDGDMTASMAQREWVQAWREAPPALDRLDEAREELGDAPECAPED